MAEQWYVVMHLCAFADVEVVGPVVGANQGVTAGSPTHYLPVFKTREEAEKWADGSPVMAITRTPKETAAGADRP